MKNIKENIANLFKYRPSLFKRTLFPSDQYFIALAEENFSINHVFVQHKDVEPIFTCKRQYRTSIVHGKALHGPTGF